MMKGKYPTITQANILFFITAVVTLAGSVLFQPILGMGANLWINEYVYILLPPLLLARFNKWPVEDVYRFKKTSTRNRIISIFSGVSMWLFAAYISKVARILLDKYVGVLPTQAQAAPSIYQGILLAIGMIILAPICEEIFFRGVVQRAYEGWNKRYGFLIAGIIFGAYHILNGISEVIPACILGVGMGYLVYKTGSIANSMLFHAAANFSAFTLGQFVETYSTTSIPLWFHIIAFTGLFLSVILVKSVKADDVSDDTGTEEYKANAQTSKSLPVAGTIFLVLSAVYLIAVGVFEIAYRLM